MVKLKIPMKLLIQIFALAFFGVASFLVYYGLERIIPENWSGLIIIGLGIFIGFIGLILVKFKLIPMG